MNRSITSEPGSFQTAAYRVYETLREHILDGRIKPGTHLVRRTLAKELGVSPIPVTEGLWRLEQDGLVESEAMYGSRVRTVTAENLRNEQALREAIECQTARYCAENASERDMEELTEQALEVDRLTAMRERDSREGILTHLNFHLSIARMGGFPLLVKELERSGFMELMRINWAAGTVVLPTPSDWHTQLVYVLKTRNPDLAEAKMREHVRYGLEGKMEALRQLT